MLRSLPRLGSRLPGLVRDLANAFAGDEPLLCGCSDGGLCVDCAVVAPSPLRGSR
jgi:hypothetical protein